MVSDIVYILRSTQYSLKYIKTMKEKEQEMSRFGAVGNIQEKVTS
jgi:hypothetical protein